MASRPLVVDLPATSAAEGTSIIARSGPASSASDIPLVGGLSPSGSFSSASRLTPSSAGDRGPAAAGNVRPNLEDDRSRPPVPPAAAAAATTEDVSKLDLAIMACNMALLVPVALNFKDLSGSWDARWKEVYGVLMMVSFVSTVAGFFTAWCPAVSWARRLSPSCARSGLVGAAALFIVFVACKLGRFVCAAGVASAAAVAVVLVVVWAWSELLPAAAEEGRPSLPDDAP